MNRSRLTPVGVSLMTAPDREKETQDVMLVSAHQ